MFHACTYQSRLYFIPDRMGKSIVNYVNHHIMPGSFLQAVFKNDLADAVGHADRENLCNLPAYINYLYNEAPSSCWGGPKEVERWVRMRDCKPAEE